MATTLDIPASVRAWEGKHRRLMAQARKAQSRAAVDEAFAEAAIVEDHIRRLVTLHRLTQ